MRLRESREVLLHGYFLAVVIDSSGLLRGVRLIREPFELFCRIGKSISGCVWGRRGGARTRWMMRGNLEWKVAGVGGVAMVSMLDTVGAAELAGVQ